MNYMLGALFAASVASAAMADLPKAEPPERPAMATFLAITVPRDAPAAYADACCKRCSKGKACGDSCISRSKSCQKGAGCACD